VHRPSNSSAAASTAAVLLSSSLAACVGAPPPPPFSAGSTSEVTVVDGDTTEATTEPTAGSDPTTTGPEPSEGTTAEPPPECPGSGGPLVEGEACTAHDQCASGICTIYTDAPINADANCAYAPPDCATRITATTLDLAFRVPVPSMEVTVVSASDAAIDPTTASPLVAAIGSEGGRIDVFSEGPLWAPEGIVALTSAPGYALTGAMVAEPEFPGGAYGLGTQVHDLWVIPEKVVEHWSLELLEDPELPDEVLPLSEQGGAMGVVRSALGDPIPDVQIVPTDPASSAVVRYIHGDGSFDAEGTSGWGLFVILGAEPGESFEAVLMGVSLDQQQVITAPGMVYTPTFTTG